MYSNFKIKKKDLHEKIVVIFLVLLCFHSVFQYYVDFKIISSLYLYFFYIIAFSLPFILLSRPKSNLHRQFFFIFFFTNFLFSFLFLYEDFGTVVFCMAIYFNLLSACPSSAPAYIKSRVDFVTDKIGGDGAFREFIETLLTNNNMMDVALNKYLYNLETFNQ